MRIIVCGGREYKDRNTVFSALDTLLPLKDQITILHGAALGADKLAEEWCEAREIHCVPFAADWNKYHRPGRKNPAGPIRNREMFNSGCDLVIAFPGGTGTADMINYAKSKGCEVIVID